MRMRSRKIKFVHHASCHFILWEYSLQGPARDIVAQTARTNCQDRSCFWNLIALAWMYVLLENSRLPLYLTNFILASHVWLWLPPSQVSQTFSGYPIKPYAPSLQRPCFEGSAQSWWRSCQEMWKRDRCPYGHQRGFADGLLALQYAQRNFEIMPLGSDCIDMGNHVLGISFLKRKDLASSLSTHFPVNWPLRRGNGVMLLLCSQSLLTQT